MKKLILFSIVLLPFGLLFAQNSLVLDFNQNNLASGTNTFKCVGSFTTFTVTTVPADTNYLLTLTKDGVILEQGNYNSLNSQTPGFFAVNSLIYAGNYDLTVVALSSNTTLTESFTFSDPLPLNFDYTVLNTQSCIQFGEIQISNISGGTPPYSLGVIDALGIFDPAFFEDSTTTSYTIEYLQSGFYTITLQDSNGCLFTVGSTNPIEIQQGSDSISIVSTSQEDSFRVCTQGGVMPLSFVLNGDTLVTDTSCVAYALCEGNYDLLVFDSANDALCSDSTEFTIEGIDGFIEQETSTAIVQSGGVRPFSYSWTKDNVLQDGQTDSVYQDGLCPGSYTCNIIDRANCNTSLSLTIDEIESNLIEDIDCSDQQFSVIETNVTGGTAPYQYMWNTSETTSSVTNLSPQLYKLTITDNNGCQISDELEVPVVKDSCLFNAFSPNGDLTNDTWVVNPSFLYENSEVIIYNRWGSKVYQSTGYKQAWDGKNSSGNLVKEGVYFYSILLKNGHEKVKGSISVFY